MCLVFLFIVHGQQIRNECMRGICSGLKKESKEEQRNKARTMMDHHIVTITRRHLARVYVRMSYILEEKFCFCAQKNIATWRKSNLYNWPFLT